MKKETAAAAPKTKKVAMPAPSSPHDDDSQDTAVVPVRRFECSTNAGGKFWEIVRDGPETTVTYGSLQSAGVRTLNPIFPHQNKSPPKYACIIMNSKKLVPQYCLKEPWSYQRTCLRVRVWIRVGVRVRVRVRVRVLLLPKTCHVPQCQEDSVTVRVKVRDRGLGLRVTGYGIGLPRKTECSAPITNAS